MQTPSLVKEGTTEVFVLSRKTSKKGPGMRQGEPFYNPAMERSRDLSVVVNQWFVSMQKKPVRLVDGLAASGIRGVRLAHEVEGDFEVTINDYDDQAFGLIEQNITHNKLTNAVASKKNLNVLLSEEHYHMIDIDPFGSPAYFIDSAVRGISNNGIICCTATDTAALCGVYPRVCLRRYGAYPYHSPVMQEIGLRILLGFVCREAAKYDKGIEPLLCYSADYYFRLYLQVRNGKTYANRSMEMMPSLPIKTFIGFSHMKAAKGSVGPLYMGNLQKKQVVKELRTNLFEKQLNTKSDLWRLLQMLEEEADAPPFFYTVETIASQLKVDLPKRETLFEYLRGKGFSVARTHISPTGLKTNASLKEIEAAFKALDKS